ncbi:hypothetical protein DL770_010315 [Monosporascus sp. CRB-9-2]|nr:hypothetical protein DL770_010315 [Monosporascus sp. CRB-9-2]
MQFTVARSLICAIALTPVMGSSVERPGDLLTFDLPPGYGVNGTIVMDTEKSLQYLQEEVGVGIDMYMSDLAKIFPVMQENSEYKFPEGSGLEGSSISYYPNEIELSVQVGRRAKCRRCAACIILIPFFFPYAYAACFASCFARCEPGV